MGLMEDILFLETVLFLFWGEQRSCDWLWARSALWAWQRTQKDGCAQRTGAHARPKPTSYVRTSYRGLTQQDNLILGDSIKADCTEWYWVLFPKGELSKRQMGDKYMVH